MRVSPVDISIAPYLGRCFYIPPLHMYSIPLVFIYVYMAVPIISSDVASQKSSVSRREVSIQHEVTLGE